MRSGIDKTAFMWMWPVKGSSNVRAVGYDRRKKELGIRFNSSPQKYIYSDVPISIYKELVQAPSRGKYVHQHIKGYYPYRRKDYTGEEFAWEEEMPSKSQKQQRYFGWLYAKKKSGDTSGLSPKDIKTMESMSKDQIRDYAATKHKKLPVVVKKAGFLNFMGKMTGYHDMKRLSQMSGVPENQVFNLYQSYMFPNSMLYSYDDAANDIKELSKRWGEYDAARAPLLQTRKGSPEEKAFLGKNQKLLDDMAYGLDAYGKELSNKYRAIKAGELTPTTKTAGIITSLQQAASNPLVKHVGGGALMGTTLGALYYGAMGPEFQTTTQRMRNGAVRGTIGGATLGGLYHIGRMKYHMPRFKDLVANRVPRA
jgi:hypothetical protein